MRKLIKIYNKLKTICKNIDMNHTFLEYYKSIFLLNKFYNIPKEIINFIFKEFLLQNLIKNLQNEYLNFTLISNYNTTIYSKINKYDFLMCIHLIDIPYINKMKNKITIEQLKDIIKEKIIKYNLNLEFSHYCCSKLGIVFKIIND
jgi:hypothetical protein